RVRPSRAQRLCSSKFTLPSGGSRSEPQRVTAGRADCEKASALCDAPPRRLVPRLRPSRRVGEVGKSSLNIYLRTARPPSGRVKARMKWELTSELSLTLENEPLSKRWQKNRKIRRRGVI